MARSIRSPSTRPPDFWPTPRISASAGTPYSTDMTKNRSRSSTCGAQASFDDRAAGTRRSQPGRGAQRRRDLGETLFEGYANMLKGGEKAATPRARSKTPSAGSRNYIVAGHEGHTGGADFSPSNATRFFPPFGPPATKTTSTRSPRASRSAGSGSVPSLRRCRHTT